MKKNSRLENRRKEIPEDIKIFVDHSFKIADRITNYLEQQKIDQKDLAKLLCKSESEISKWMTGTHNFTIKTIAKIEAVLNGRLIFTEQNKGLQESVNIIYIGAYEPSMFGELNESSRKVKTSYFQYHDIAQSRFTKLTSACN